MTLSKNNRYLARKVIYDGQEFGLSVVEFRGDEAIITPFTAETPNTIYLPGTLLISHSPDRSLSLTSID